MGDKPIPQLNYRFMRVVAGFVMTTPGILNDAFISPFAWMLRGIWSTAGTAIIYFGSVSLFVMAYRTLDIDRRFRYYFHAAVLVALEALCDAMRPPPR